APAGANEELVAGVWQRVLGLEAVGRDENFFDLGGHSLLAVKVFRDLAEASGHALALTDVFRYPSVSTFAAYLDRLNAGDDGADETQAASLSRGARRRAALSRGRAG
ncbi:MAG: phosphopantetheine-binding protein, partial [Acidimicrobiia bacterium]